MQNKNFSARIRRRIRIRKKIEGTNERPRLSICKSLKNIQIQIIDDVKGNTLVSASTLEKDLKSKFKRGNDLNAAKIIGGVIAERAKNKGINKIVFDRSGYIYHGKIKAIAESAREKGLIF